ncbi:hypothetical protein SOASR014_37770 [Pectobacterium carotovorum subsp. carotovorum]|nr:hypothetical protein SOASR014_37770 [Pectobacterium carotovorum subsp. carotovorum]GLX46173.1 hypothetical protein Pcaca01_38410 [Pectobacterium carotovorum subsp. carotovorum]
MSEKAKYRVLRLSHIHNKLWEPGEEVEYDGKPGSALEPLNDAAFAAKEAAAGVVAPAVIVPVDGGEKPGEEVDDDLADLQQQYEELFGKKTSSGKQGRNTPREGRRGTSPPGRVTKPKRGFGPFLL